jgi:hypothetical protein
MTTLEALRRFLFVILIVGMGGTAVELVLLEHTEGRIQVIPVVLLTLGVVAVVRHGVWPGAGSAGTVRAVMAAFVVAGLVGVYYHYEANVEFQLEGDPSLSGRALLMKVLEAKTPPALAPGVMVQLGLLGLAYTFRHKER